MSNIIYIVSGEGEIGSAEVYTGKLTVRALKSRLTRERCSGDRWARCDLGIAPHIREICGEEWAIARMLDGGCWVCGTKDCSEHITTPEQYDEKFSV